MKRAVKISEAEWQIMKVIWEKAPVTAVDIIAALKPRTQWSPTTVYTLIQRLMKKKMIQIKEGSSPYVYRPLVTKEQVRREENQSFLNRVYDGSLNLMLAQFLDDIQLSDEEIEDLRKILDRGRPSRS